ncbi:hypothetical protein Q5H93_12920 [Hymenobacter sp. ASUV-10]|uniref:Polysaccharide chain length determinant N-terminal domain-containing protein n=1 Tax=Hymenobacter aranciens TaxID=3063996 RepID=A0ABT9BBJ1_9BACT|nr:hypothetical protein [Hymenobacter sp. ASUV-10]MDO7875639.1 hypothetical protein [Hymenobacter sp. ASUV-10]
MSASSFSLVGLGPIINRWKSLVGGAVVLAAIISTVVALVLPNVYKSTSVFFPTTPQTSDPDRLLDESTENRRTLELTGRAEDLDRVITIGESQPLAEMIIKKYNLHKHYEIGTPGDDASDNAVLSEFSSNLSIVHNERDAIELTFMDTDKFLAARIANDIVQAIDSMNQQLTYENRRKVLNLYRLRYETISNLYEKNRRALVAARYRKGVFGLEMQGRYLAKEIIRVETELRKAEAGGGGNVTALRRAMHGLTRADGGNVINLENFTNGGDSVSMLADRTNNLQNRLVSAQAAYETATLSIKGQVSSLYVVQKAYPATKKVKPVRWLIVVGSVLITLVLSVVVVSLLELFRHQRQRGEAGS